MGKTLALRPVHGGTLIYLILLAGCRCTERPRNISAVHREVARYYDSGCFNQELLELVTHVKRSFTQRATSVKQVVIFDVDFTVLDYYEKLKHIQFGYVAKLFHTWIMAADAPAMPYMKALFDYFKGLGYGIIFITERRPDEFEATEQNLHSAGFDGYIRLIIRKESQCTIPYITYKGCIRADLVAQGYEIVASVSDQEQDFMGGNVGFIVKVPNYLYNITHLQELPS